MKDQSRIPTNKVERATKFVATGVKIGGNYIKHYAKKAMNPDLSREELHKDNAADIYESLSELKGSALKVAQMMSMDKNLLPRAYSDKFQMSQYSAPPLSGPLVVKTFQEYFGKSPAELYDTFNLKASNAASIGQVHEATLKGKKLAVKIQYPGVANSISADLKMVKPVAVRLVGLNEADINRYMEEVETKLLEETDYELEVRRGTEISEACSQAIEGLIFPKYYPELSSKRIITMDWLDGMHLKEFLATNPTQEIRNRVGQTLWDFYEYQIHTLRQLHADPHPGNFLIRPDGTVGIIDFGCVKEIPEWFYHKHFALLNPRNLEDKDKILQLFYDLQFLYPNDEPREKALFFDIFVEMCNLLGRPFHTDTFDFADDEYFNSIYEYGENLSRMKEIKEQKVARGSKDALYINRTYFGLYSMLNELRANITTHSVFKTMTI
ncbi:Predicted unusual protein kinase regulating ubiquinone biosynthesis, AarF/ABC1/UbiB family [Flexibacter flexilis DSM 6793]|uniref:Predicted unusual protein kinase regulating ubiquinone biosynthesis, AarF/ABC1/UbiB family n=1 Tax=Flexibacter flexilis DSM 6793 TaxID=927664 RepID=A0A1I1KSJ5_9BACT|nr:AarF/ABC1/UbiB kinase family protein [Flexibacter flexilis]SFC63585.1 Predicted unusual protein kinase regulating ubiquinone biosynthesis, AarF/ABC1/UbiB family [Flexibacter flexilis DSM 6793]